MTEPPIDRPPDEHGQPPRGRNIALGFGAAILGTAAVFVLPALVGQVFPFSFFPLWLASLGVVIFLGSQIAKRRGSGFGLGVAWGCGVVLLLAGGICIALINSFSTT